VTPVSYTKAMGCSCSCSRGRRDSGESCHRWWPKGKKQGTQRCGLLARISDERRPGWTKGTARLLIAARARAKWERGLDAASMARQRLGYHCGCSKRAMSV
jgi:hypothetical protein